MEAIDGAVYESAAELVRDFIAHVEALKTLGLWDLFRDRNRRLLDELTEGLS